MGYLLTHQYNVCFFVDDVDANLIACRATFQQVTLRLDRRLRQAKFDRSCITSPNSWSSSLNIMKYHYINIIELHPRKNPVNLVEPYRSEPCLDLKTWHGLAGPPCQVEFWQGPGAIMTTCFFLGGANLKLEGRRGVDPVLGATSLYHWPTGSI